MKAGGALARFNNAFTRCCSHACCLPPCAPRVISCVASFSSIRPDVGEVAALSDLRFRLLRKRAGIFFLHMARTWCNAWATMQRLQKGSGPCAWGCSPGVRDLLAHLLVCRMLWGAIETRPECQFEHPWLGWDCAGTSGARAEAPCCLGFVIAVQAYHRRQERPLRSRQEGEQWASVEVEGAFRQLSSANEASGRRIGRRSASFFLSVSQ